MFTPPSALRDDLNIVAFHPRRILKWAILKDAQIGAVTSFSQRDSIHILTVSSSEKSGLGSFFCFISACLVSFRVYYYLATIHDGTIPKSLSSSRSSKISFSMRSLYLVRLSASRMSTKGIGFELPFSGLFFFHSSNSCVYRAKS